MRESLKANISGKDQVVVRLMGPINEVADFEPIRFASLKSVEIDMGGVTAINSMGIGPFVIGPLQSRIQPSHSRSAPR